MYNAAKYQYYYRIVFPTGHMITPNAYASAEWTMLAGRRLSGPGWLMLSSAAARASGGWNAAAPRCGGWKAPPRKGGSNLAHPPGRHATYGALPAIGGGYGQLGSRVYTFS